MSEPKRTTPLGAVAGLLVILLVGAAATGFGVLALMRTEARFERGLGALAALVGAGVAVASARWLRLLLSSNLRRTFAGSRLPSAYFAWALWSALFLFLSYRAGVRFGEGPGLALAALTLHFSVRQLDLLPRLLLLDDALIGPFLPRTPFDELEAWELREVPERRLLCLRLLARGDDTPMSEWLAPNQRAALERLLTAKRLTPRTFPLPAVPPAL